MLSTSSSSWSRVVLILGYVHNLKIKMFPENVFGARVFFILFCCCWWWFYFCFFYLQPCEIQAVAITTWLLMMLCAEWDIFQYENLQRICEKTQQPHKVTCRRDFSQFTSY